MKDQQQTNVMIEKDLYNQISLIARETGHVPSQSLATLMPLMAYAAVKLAEAEPGTSLKDILASTTLPARIQEQILHDIEDRHLPAIQSLMTSGYASLEDVRRFVLSFDFSLSSAGSVRVAGDCSTPAEIVDLALAILGDGKSFGDPCCGWGTFLTRAAELHPNARFIGTDINESVLTLAAARLDLLDANFRLGTSNLLTSPTQKVDRLFAQLPFGMQMRYAANAETADGELGRPSLCDWVFMRNICRSLTKEGMAVCLIAPSGLTRRTDTRAREFFVKSSLVKAVVQLPRGIMRGVGIGPCLIVLGEKSRGVRMVDATDLAESHGRWAHMGASHIAEVLSRLSCDGERSSFVPNKDVLLSEDCTFAPSFYLSAAAELGPTTELGKLAEEIVSGAPLTAKRSAEGAESGEGPKLLTAAALSEGTVNTAGLPRLSEVGKYGKQVLRAGDLVVSKSASPFKVAVVREGKGTGAIACGNLYVIRLSAEMDPWYVAAYLSSEVGVAEVQRLSSGNLITIPLSNLKTLGVPNLTPKRREEIARSYREAIEHSERLEAELAKVRHTATTAFSL